MELYAFVMTPMSGKTTYAKRSPYFVDIDDSLDYATDDHLWEMISQKDWEQLTLYKIERLKLYLKDNYKDTDRLILFTHSYSEAKGVGAKVLGSFKVCAEDFFKRVKYLPEEESKISRRSRSLVIEAWNNASWAEELTHEEIENRIMTEAKRLRLLNNNC